MDRATEYAKQVVSGQVVAGLPHIQACQRHLTDIERSASPDFAYMEARIIGTDYRLCEHTNDR